ncbi:GNAT family N-acetyltransferase, partial [Corynebacterium sp. HMSC22B11]
MTCTFHAYEQLHAQPEVVAAVHTLLREVEQADGVAALGEAFLKGIDGDHGHQHIVAMTDERVVGVLALDGAVTASVSGENPTAELAVAPDVRRQGVARGMLAAAREDLGLTGPLDTWAHGDLAPARAMA